MISIIVPIYNVKDYLDRCIKSIVNQSFKDIEIILINDGSTDSSEQICLKWQEIDDRIIYVKKKNEGPGIARDLGVKISSGEYITFVDSDDWLDKDALYYMYEAEKKSSADIVICDTNYILKDYNGNLNVKVSKMRIDSDVIIESKNEIRLIDTARLSLCGKLYKREFFVKNKVDQPNHIFEDAVVTPVLIAKADTIYHVPIGLYNYYRSREESRVHETSSYIDLEKSLVELKENFIKEGLFEKYYEALKKVSYSLIRFVYKKLLRDGKEIENEDLKVIDILYGFMDVNYPDWINIDKYSVGFIGGELLKSAIINTIFNNLRLENCKDDYKKLIDKDIVIINLIDDLFYKDIELWINKNMNNLMYLQENFKGKEIILVKFINESYKKQSEIIDKVYDEYKKSNLNLSVINFSGDDNVYDESMSWDLSDEILNELSE